MPRSNFGTGSPITSQFLNKVARPVITGLDEDGHLPLLDNTAFQNQAGVVSYDFYNLVDRLQSHAAVGGGLNLYVHGAKILLPNGTILDQPAVTLTLPDNAVSWVFADVDGIKHQTSNPPSGVRSARVTTGAGQITAVEDLRYDYLWIPQVQSLAVFGGTSRVDFVCTNNQVLRGTIECRDFTVPLGVQVLLDREVTIRASRNVNILGGVFTQSNPVSWGSVGTGQLGLTTGALSEIIQGEQTIPQGVGTNLLAARPNANRGVFFMEVYGWTTASNAAIYARYDTYNTGAAAGLAMTAGGSGAIFTVNAAGTINMGAGAVINCSATHTTSLNITLNHMILTAHPSSGLGPNVWSVNSYIAAPQPVAGRVFLNSLQSITVASSAQITVRGADRGRAIRTRWDQLTGLGSGSGVLTDWALPGAGGGGSIHFQAPTLAVAPGATLLVTPGNQPVTPAANRADGPGCSGNGYIAATDTAPTSGNVTSSTEVPRER